MRKVIYSASLKKQFELIRKTSEALVDEEPGKSVEQLLAEIEFVKELLDETKALIQDAGYGMQGA